MIPVEFVYCANYLVFLWLGRDYLRMGWTYNMLTGAALIGSAAFFLSPSIGEPLLVCMALGALTAPLLEAVLPRRLRARRGAFDHIRSPEVRRILDRFALADALAKREAGKSPVAKPAPRRAPPQKPGPRAGAASDASSAAVPAERVSVLLRRQVPAPEGAPRSWIGGLPMMPQDIPWPAPQGAPLHFAAQIACAELPRDLWDGMGPRRGWLLFFLDAADPWDDWDPDAGDEPASIHRVAVLHIDALGPERDAPAQLGPLADPDYAGPRFPFTAGPDDWPNVWRRWPVELREARQSLQPGASAPQNDAATRAECGRAAVAPSLRADAVMALLDRAAAALGRAASVPPLPPEDREIAARLARGKRIWAERRAAAGQAASVVFEASAALHRDIADPAAFRRAHHAAAAAQAEWIARQRGALATLRDGFALLDAGAMVEPGFLLRMLEVMAQVEGPQALFADRDAEGAPFWGAAPLRYDLMLGDALETHLAAVRSAAAAAETAPRFDRGPHRMGGWNDPVQSPPSPAGRQLLLQLSCDRDMNWNWGGGGRHFIWIADEDLRRGRLDRAWCMMENT